MNEDEIKTVVELFQIEGSLQCFNEINSGLINRTYRVIFNLNGSTEKSYIFQKMNSDIFKKPDELMENIAMVTDFIRPKIRTLAMSISIEAAELLEIFQWNNKGSKERIQEELGDVLIYCIDMANSLGMDITDTILKKIKSNAKKYPEK